MNINIKKTCRLFLVASLAFFFTAFTFAKNNYWRYADFPNLSYLPRFTVTGSLGEKTNGSADFMLPLLWNGTRLFYLDANLHHQGKTQNWLFAQGIGMRQIFNCNEAFGAYLFSEYNNYKDTLSPSRHYVFWVLNPGLEYLGKDWDVTLNGYFPLGNKKQLLRKGFADQFGVYQYERFQKHTMYNKHLQEYASLGNGADVSLGSVMPYIPRLKIYLGTYYFRQKDSTRIIGGLSRALFTFNQHAALIAEDTYDNIKHNTFTLGIRITFGGARQKQGQKDIRARLADPVQHNWLLQNYGLSIPLTKAQHVFSMSDSGFDVELNNVQFVKAEGAGRASNNNNAADGTYEHPFTAQDFNQNTINKVGKSANFFVEGKSKINFLPQITLLQGQNIYGRSEDFIKPAQGDNRPLFIGSIALNGNNHLDAIRLENQAGLAKTGIVIHDNKGAIYLNNLKIGLPDDATKSYAIAIDVANCNMLNISNAEIYAHNDWHGATSYGIKALNSNINISSSAITANATLANSNNKNVTSYGIYADHANLQITNTNLTGTANSNSPNLNSAISTGYGIYALNGANVKLTANSPDKFTIMGTGFAKNTGKGSATGTGYGIYSDHATVTVNKNMVSGTGRGESTAASATSSGAGYGVYAKNDSRVALNASEIFGNGFGNNALSAIGNGFGIRAENSYIGLADSKVQATGNHNAYSVYGTADEEMHGSVIHINGTNNLFLAHNTSSHGNAYGLYLTGHNSQVIGDYQYNQYDIQGGAHSGKWHF